MTKSSLQGAPVVQLDIEGMTCAACAQRVEKGLNRLPGVVASVNYATEKASLWGDVPDLETVMNQVAKTGYRASLVGTSPAKKTDRLRALRHRVIVSAVLTAPIIVLSMVPLTQFAGWQWWVLALALPVVTWGAWPFHRAAWVNARHGQATMDTLVSLGVSAAVSWSLYALFFGGAGEIGMTMSMHLFAPPDQVGNEVYFEVAAAVTTFLLLGRYLETASKRDAGKALNALLEATPQEVRVVSQIPGPEGMLTLETIVAIGTLGLGQRFVVLPGERIATDGRVVEGFSTVDLSVVTGESVPVDVAVGDSVIGGAINHQGRIVVEATSVGSETQVARMAAIVERAQNGKSSAQRLADSISGVFVPVVLVLSILTLLGWLVWGPSAEWAFRAAVATLIIACPCALGLATPTALLAGTGRGAQLGILLSGPEALERSQHIDTVVLDKTGTLTTGEMSVTRSVVSKETSEKQFVSHLVALESTSTHPIAQTVVAQFAASTSRLKVDDVVAYPGQGVSGTVAGIAILAGRASWLRAQSVAVPEDIQAEFSADTQTAVWLARDGVLWGGVFLEDTVKPEAVETVRELRARGVDVVILSGDSARAVQKVAHEVGVNTAKAGLSPEEKVEAIAALQRDGRHVAMVGDGINDAPALASANLGIALSTGTDQAMAASDITITQGDIERIPLALDLARATLGTIRGNLFWAFAYNVVAIPLAIAGVLNPLIAGAAMAFSSVFVVTNSLRLRAFRATTKTTSVPQTAQR